MQALIVIDAQNEFSVKGQRPVPEHQTILDVILRHVGEARSKGQPIAWVHHHNKPEESAFQVNTWGWAFSPGCGPQPSASPEKEFHKEVYGAFTGSDIGEWIAGLNVDAVLITGFYTHGCVATTAREAIMKGLQVLLDPAATGSCDIHHPILGDLSASESRRAALLQLANMGASIIGSSSGR